jgi:hypothetical protein
MVESHYGCGSVSPTKDGRRMLHTSQKLGRLKATCTAAHTGCSQLVRISSTGPVSGQQPANQYGSQGLPDSPEQEDRM